MIRAWLVVGLVLSLALPARADGPELPGRKKRIAGVVSVLGGAALVVAGAALLNQSGQDNDSTNSLFQGGGVWTQHARDIDAEGRRDNLAAEVLVPLGVGAMLAGVVVAVIGWRQDKRQHATPVPPINGGGAASWSVSF